MCYYWAAIGILVCMHRIYSAIFSQFLLFFIQLCVPVIIFKFLFPFYPPESTQRTVKLEKLTHIKNEKEKIEIINDGIINSSHVVFHSPWFVCHSVVSSINDFRASIQPKPILKPSSPSPYPPSNPFYYISVYVYFVYILCTTINIFAICIGHKGLI